MFSIKLSLQKLSYIGLNLRYSKIMAVFVNEGNLRIMKMISTTACV